jgi:hypothetical protein
VVDEQPKDHPLQDDVMLLKAPKESIYNKFDKTEFKLEHVAFFK